ncbi:MAG TPA: GNAT family N-acetyltransferase [Nocardioidaceae bacterium]|nr:GNAT family N-acetyltransferase [Nocardioidaceae bacterium]
MQIRTATAEDWPAIWAFMREIVVAGETFSWDRDLDEIAARERWYAPPPAHTLVAVDADGTVLGAAVTGPNHEGPASHIATASFMVDPNRSGRGVGRALGERVLKLARSDGYRGMQFNAVVEANGRAVGLWRSLGFEIMTTIPDGFRHPTEGYVGLHIMFRRL